jgi:hypothetical protein
VEVKSEGANPPANAQNAAAPQQAQPQAAMNPMASMMGNMGNMGGNPMNMMMMNMMSMMGNGNMNMGN